MKLSICGKGGSGKSTVVALLAREFLSRGTRVFVVDSDESNAELYRMLGLDRPPAPLMELAGGRKSYRRALGDEGGTILARHVIRSDDVPPEHVSERDGLRLVSVGKIHQALEGCACPVGALAREFLKRLSLAENEIAIVDMEAGIEHFGRGVGTSVDVVVAVVEPSRESLGLAERVRDLASESGARFAGAVLNKVGSTSVARKLEEALRTRGVSTLAVLRLHSELAEVALEGGPLPQGVASEEVAALANVLVAVPLQGTCRERSD